MKKIFLLSGLLITIACSCEKEELIVDEIIHNTDEVIEQIDEVVDGANQTTDSTAPEIVVSRNSNYINWSNATEETFYGGNGKGHFNINGNEYFVITSDSQGSNSYLFKKNDTIWDLIDINTELSMVGINSLFKISENSFIVSETGEKYYDPVTEWGGYIYIGTIQNDKLSYRKITNVKDYYTNPATGDITGDGLYDIILNSGWVYIQNQDETFTPHNISNFGGDFYGVPYSNYQETLDLFDLTRLHELENHITQTTVDLFDGGRNEVILSFIDVSANVGDDVTVARGDVLIYEYNESSQKYEVVFELPRRTPGEIETASQIEVADVNNDGINDILLSIVSGDSSPEVTLNPPIEVWLGNGDKTFYKHHEFSKQIDPLGFKLFDINHDGYLDIVLNPFGDSPEWIRNWCAEDCYQRELDGLPVKDGLILDKAIYLNDGTGRFTKIQKEIIIDNAFLTWMYTFMRDGNLCFAGAVYNYVDGVTMDIEFIEVEFKNYF